MSLVPYFLFFFSSSFVNFTWSIDKYCQCYLILLSSQSPLPSHCDTRDLLVDGSICVLPPSAEFPPSSHPYSLRDPGRASFGIARAEWRSFRLDVCYRFGSLSHQLQHFHLYHVPFQHLINTCSQAWAKASVLSLLHLNLTISHSHNADNHTTRKSHQIWKLHATDLVCTPCSSTIYNNHKSLLTPIAASTQTILPV